MEYEIQTEALKILSINNISVASLKFVFRRRMEYHVTNTFLQVCTLLIKIMRPCYTLSFQVAQRQCNNQSRAVSNLYRTEFEIWAGITFKHLLKAFFFLWQTLF